MGIWGRRLFFAVCVCAIFSQFGCQNPNAQNGLFTESGLGEHGKTTRADKDRGPFVVFENAQTLLLSFFLSVPMQKPERDIFVCYRVFSEFADRSKDDASVTETSNDSCSEGTGEWVRVAFTTNVGPLNTPLNTGFSADKEWVFHFGGMQEDDSPLNLRFDDYTAGHYRAVIGDLMPATRYEYRVVYLGEKIANRVVIETPPGSKSKDAFDFAAIADLRSYDGSSQQDDVLEQLRSVVSKNAIRFLILPGDISNEAGTSSEYIEHYFKIYDSIQRMIPFYPVQGNHDLQTSRFLAHQSSDGYYFFHMIDLPRNSVAEQIEHINPFTRSRVSGYRSFYSFDWGSTHFVAVDRSAIDQPSLGFEEYGKDSVQYEWIKKDLENAQTARWRIVYFHAPPERGASGASAELMALLKEKNVDLVISGHAERPSLSLDDNDSVPWVVLPSGGARARYFSNGGASDCILDHKKRFGIATFHVEQNSLAGRLTSSQGDPIATFELKKGQNQARAELPTYDVDAENCE